MRGKKYNRLLREPGIIEPMDCGVENGNENKSRSSGGNQRADQGRVESKSRANIWKRMSKKGTFAHRARKWKVVRESRLRGGRPIFTGGKRIILRRETRVKGNSNCCTCGGSSESQGSSAAYDCAIFSPFRPQNSLSTTSSKRMEWGERKNLEDTPSTRNSLKKLPAKEKSGLSFYQGFSCPWEKR